MNNVSRRKFLAATGTLLAGAGASQLPFFNRKTPPSDTLYVGLIGCRSMGFGNLENMLRVDGVHCAALCDVDGQILESRAGDVERITGKRPALYRDYRRMLERKDLDAVIIGTPDHWHCLQTVHALEAGKHIYVEKPLANTIREIEIVRDAAGRYGQLLQVGQQQRSSQHWKNAVERVQSGDLGKIREVSLWGNFGYGAGAEPVKDTPVPSHVDYDMWLGPAPERLFNENHFHGSWRFYWPYGGGVQTDWGVHLLDIAIWAMQPGRLPRSVYSTGGVFSGLNRSIDAADTQATLYNFDKYFFEWKHTGGVETPAPYQRNYGIAFVGNQGTLVVNRESWEIIPAPGSSLEKAEGPGSGNDHYLHAKNFVESIRGNETLNAPVETGYTAALYAHAGNVSYRSGDTLYWNEEGELENAEKYRNLLTPHYRNPWTLPSV